MAAKALQRTLLVGLGQIGAQTADRLLAELHRRLGPVPIIQGVAVLTEEVSLQTIAAPVLMPTADAFEQHINTALVQISQLDNLAQLARHNITLHRPDEIHIIIITNPAEAWVKQILAPTVAAVRQRVDQTLNCYAAVSGVLLAARLPKAEATENNPPVADPLEGLAAVAQFDRSCFLAGQTNEAGLYIGDAEHLIQQAVHFLRVLISENAAIGETWHDDSPAGWGLPLTTFGLTAVHWPGPILVNSLSKRWVQAMLSELTSLPANGALKGDLAQQARAAAQQWLTGHKLAPPMLIEQLATSMPPLPDRLDGLVPDPPWPWLLVDARPHIEQAVQRWYDDWLAAGQEQINTHLAGLETAWAGQTRTWLDRLTGQHRAGVVLVAQSYMAAVSELLNAFVEGLEQKLEDAEADLIHIEQQLSDISETLSHTLAPLPASYLTALFSWGWYPWRWPRYWTQCRHGQTLVRNFAHLSRGRLMALQQVWYYEEILPFYKAIRQSWRQVVAHWSQGCKAVLEAARTPALTGWQSEVAEALGDSGGPWDQSLVDSLYHETIELHGDAIWEQVGMLSDWLAAELTPAGLIERFRAQVQPALSALVAIPIDQALVRQWPNETSQADWFAGLIEQARPYWRFDETLLAENARAQVRLETWLLLPNAQHSPLHYLEQTQVQPLHLLSTGRPEELAIITLRRINYPLDKAHQITADEWAKDVGEL